MAKRTQEIPEHNRYRALVGGNSNGYDLKPEIEKAKTWGDLKFSADISEEEILVALKEKPNNTAWQAHYRAFKKKNDDIQHIIKFQMTI